MSKCSSGLWEEFIKFQYSIYLWSSQGIHWGVFRSIDTQDFTACFCRQKGKTPAISLDFRVSCLGLCLCSFTLPICLQWGQANMLAFAILFFIISFFSCREISPLLCYGRRWDAGLILGGYQLLCKYWCVLSQLVQTCSNVILSCFIHSIMLLFNAKEYNFFCGVFHKKFRVWDPGWLLPLNKGFEKQTDYNSFAALPSSERWGFSAFPLRVQRSNNFLIRFLI